MIIIATSLSILSHENATRIIRFLSDAKPGENRARKFSSLRRRRERGFPIREAGSFERDRFQQLHPASVRRKRMDSPCRGHIGDLGHGEYFCQRFHLDSNVTSQPLPFLPPPPNPFYRGQDGGFYTPDSDLHLHINSLAFWIFLSRVFFFLRERERMDDFLNFCRETNESFPILDPRFNLMERRITLGRLHFHFFLKHRKINETYEEISVKSCVP